MRYPYIVELHVTANNIKHGVLHNNAFVANLCRQQQYNVLRSSCKVADIFARV